MAEIRYVNWDGLVYYDGKIKEYINENLQKCIRMGGYVHPEALPDPTFETLNFIYRLTVDFETTSDFVISGEELPAGTWVQVIETEDGRYLYDIFSTTAVVDVFEEYATLEYVDNTVNNISQRIDEIEEQVLDNKTAFDNLEERDDNLENRIIDLEKLDHSQFITQESLQESLSTYAKTEELPDVSLLATKTELEQVQQTAGSNSVRLMQLDSDLVDINAKLEDIPSKTSDLINDSKFITKDELDSEGFIREHQDISGKLDITVYTNDKESFARKDELFSKSYNDLTDKPTIPDVSDFATKTYVDEAIDNIEITTGSEILFTDKYIVKNPVGGFQLNQSVQGLTAAELFTILLGLELDQDNPIIPPEGNLGEIVEEIISTEAPIYSQDGSGNLVKTEFDHNVWTEEEASVQMDNVNTFYQIVDANNNVIQSGYNEATDYAPATMKVALVDSINEIEVHQYDTLSSKWKKVENFVMVKSETQNIDGYTIWEVPREYEILPGSTYRFVIIN